MKFIFTNELTGFPYRPSPSKIKGKMARMVATKAALSISVDALSDADSKSSADAASIGIENRAKLESRLHALEYHNNLTATTPFKGEKRRSDRGSK